MLFNLQYVIRRVLSVAKATLQSQMSVRPSVCHRNPLASQNRSYQPSSLSTIVPINHQSYQPLSLSTICDPRIANVHLSVCLSVTKTPQPLSIMPTSQISAYKQSRQSAIVPLSHHTPPLSLSIGQNAYQPSCPYCHLTYALVSQLLSHSG